MKTKKEKEKLAEIILQELDFFKKNYDVELIDLEVVDLINRLIDCAEIYVKARDFIEKGKN